MATTSEDVLVTVRSMAGDIILGPERLSRSHAVPVVRLRLRRSRQSLGQMMCVKLYHNHIELGDEARLGADEESVELSATFSELTHDDRMRMARETAGLGIFATHGFGDMHDSRQGGSPLEVELLACSIHFFARMCADELGAYLVRRKSKSELRNMMHGENITYTRAFMNSAEIELESRLVHDCFSRHGYHGLGYVLGAFLALELQSEQDMRSNPWGAIGPSSEQEKAWFEGSDYEWVESSPVLTDCVALGNSGSLEPEIRRCTVSENVYPRHVWRGPQVQSPPPGCFLRIGSLPGHSVFYALRASVRVVLPHFDPSYGTSVDAMKLGLPSHIASGAGIVDVRLSYEFAVNPQGTPVDLPSDEFADAFFAGRRADDLILALLADVGWQRCGARDLYMDHLKSVAVLALLRCSERENVHLHSKAVMYHSSKLDAEAVRVCKEALKQCSLLARWRAFKLQVPEDILTYSCLHERPTDWLIKLPQAKRRRISGKQPSFW